MQELSSYDDTPMTGSPEASKDNSPEQSDVEIIEDSDGTSYYYDTDSSEEPRRAKKRGHGSTSSSDRPRRKKILRKKSNAKRQCDTDEQGHAHKRPTPPADISAALDEPRVDPAMTHTPSSPSDDSVHVNIPSSDSFEVNREVETVAEVHQPPRERNSDIPEAAKDRETSATSQTAKNPETSETTESPEIS
ncbi:hypothetical protein KM043_000059 [Ampulex compressa]|nr:hypothetical protein KM043_000059 [Ampulex compressa]